MTKYFSRYVYTTFYTINQICCVAERKTAPQIPAELLSNTTKNNTSIITSHPYLNFMFLLPISSLAFLFISSTCGEGTFTGLERISFAISLAFMVSPVF